MVKSKIQNIQIQIDGMTCASCEGRVRRVLQNTPGVKSARVDYGKGVADIELDPNAAVSDLRKAVEKAGYRVGTGNAPKQAGFLRTAGILLIIVALYAVFSHFGILNLLVPSQLAETNMDYGMLFLVGLLTSVHCVAMCGGINLSQTVGKSGLSSSAWYNFGRLASYTVIGFLVGALGSVISFTATAQGILKLVASVFMVVMGVNMLGIFPALRKLTIRLPHIDLGNRSPLIVGLLNGLMPCGPLQSMRIYALSTGSPVKGAASMLLFALGTVPLMFGLGALSSALSKKFAQKMITVGAVLVVILGLSMFSQGWSLSGFFSPASAGGANAEPAGDVASMENGIQVVHSTLQSGRYPAITVEKGIPVKWVIDAPKGSINGCNNAIYIPAYAISATFLFDLLTVIAFPWIGRLLGLSDTSYGLWVGTAVNDTSSVVAAGYGFSEMAGSFAVIVKLTRTLFIVPMVLVFSYIHAKRKLRSAEGAQTQQKVRIASIFPWFILFFVGMVAVRSTGFVPENVVSGIAFVSKLFMTMALGAIGLKTNVREVKGIGWKPMLLGVTIDTSVVFVALGVQALLQMLF